MQGSNLRPPACKAGYESSQVTEQQAFAGSGDADCHSGCHSKPDFVTQASPSNTREPAPANLQDAAILSVLQSLLGGLSPAAKAALAQALKNPDEHAGR